MMVENDDRLDQVLKTLEPLMRRTGILTSGERLMLDRGEPSYGRPWRLFITGGAPRLSLPPRDSYLGRSKREALDSLTLIMQTLVAVVQANKDAIPPEVES